jgi:hypothetical protein
VNSERRRDATGAERSPEARAERLVDELLRRRLRAGQDAPPAGACLEPDTLAAWIEGSLRGEELAAAESHSAGCERCQAMLAAMVQTEPAVAPRRWWQSLTARWVVPIAAAATAAALWIAVSPDTLRHAPVASSEADSAAVPSAQKTERAPGTPAPSIAPSPSMAAPARAAEERSSLADRVQEQQADRKASAEPRANTVGGEAKDLSARRDRAEPGSTVDSAVAAAKLKHLEANAASPPASPEQSAEKQLGRSAAPGPPAQPVAEVKAREGLPASPPSAEPAPAAAARSRLASEAPASFRSTAATSIEIVSPNPAIRWRPGNAGLVFRSADGGATWVAQNTGWATPLEVTAGASPAPDVCWLAGRGGAVLLSVDGKTWQRRPFPEAVDLVAVAATDAKRATLTTSDGRRFSTSDGGATWSRTAPQENPHSPF